MIDRPKPVQELAYIFGKIGWECRLCDMTETQILAIVFGIQESEKLENEIALTKLEDAYVNTTGIWPSTSIPF